jgi:hypothetical protein
MMSLGLIKFFVDNKLSELRGLELIQGDTLKFLVRIPNSIVSQSAPVVRFIALDAPNPTQSVQTIGSKDFVGTLNEAIATTDFTLTLNPIDTENLILDSTLGSILNLHPTDAKWCQPAKKLYLEIQLTALGVNKSWQGDITIKGDLFKENSSEALPGAQKFILTLSP